MLRSNGRRTAEHKPPPVQNPGMARPDKGRIVLGRPCRGHHPAYRRLNHAVPPAGAGFPARPGRVALGYRGSQAADRAAQLAIPTQTPRQSPKPPHPPVRAEHKAATTALRRVRLFSAPAMGGRQRAKILVHPFRHRIEHVEDDVIGVGAGLWNLVLSY
jgi:hypothetical protein